MNSSTDDPYPPNLMGGLDDTQIFDADMAAAPLDSSSFFNSAFATDPTTGFLEDDGLYGPALSSPFPVKEQSGQNEAGLERLADSKSTSPESLSQDSSSDSSGNRKRKSSSRSSHSPQHLLMAGKPRERVWPNGPGQQQQSSGLAFKQGQKFDQQANWDLAHRGNREQETDGDSAASSPSLLNAGNRHVAIPQDSPSNASANSFLQPVQQALPNGEATFSMTPGAATNYAQVYGSLASPVGRPDEYINGAALTDMHAAFQPFAYPGANAVAASGPLAGPPSAMNGPYSAPFSQQYGPSWSNQQPHLLIQHAPTKSRVETQIPIKLYLWPVPEHVKKLHLQRHTISKPKLLSKPHSSKSPDTFELYASLVCTSAMLDPAKHKKALARAAAHPESLPYDAASPDDGDLEGGEESSLNGGDVQICQGCITRERKRAGRKKARKPEEDELWMKDEAKRIIVFNTHEYKEWSEVADKTEVRASSTRSHAEPDRKEHVRVPPGTMVVELPMRIACYCRHHQEKTGFQVIMTIKDHQDQLIAQQISANIMITDDHKTHAPPVPVGPTNAYFEDAQHLPNGSMMQREPLDRYGLARNAHSATDLHGLQNGFHPAFLSQNLNAFAMPQPPSQPNSASGTPQNLSRQASPSAHMGPNVKRRKASGGPVKVPENLTMTRLQTGLSNLPNGLQTTMGTGMSSTSAATSPFHAGFPTNHGLPTRPIARHRHQRSAQISTGPPTPNTLEQGAFNFGNRSQSLENFAAYQPQFSAPSSALPSRAPSPAAFHQTQTMAHPDMQASQLHLANPSTGAMSPMQPPKVDKVIPFKGPMSGGIEVTCLGSGFHRGLVVMFGEAVATTSFWGDTCLICMLPPAARAGSVFVSVQPIAQSNAHSSMRYPPLPTRATQRVTFTYQDDNNSQILKDAFTVLMNKQTGRVGNVEEYARGILGKSAASSTQWAGGNQQGNGNFHQAPMHGPARDRFDTEAAVLKLLDSIDLDDSPFPVQLDLRAQNGQTLLHRAASLGYQQLVAALLARGANADARDRNGMSPMHMAALYGRTQIVRRLRMARGDPNMRSLAGFVPADMATSEAAWREAMAQTFARPKTAPNGHKGRSLPGSSVSLVSFAPTPSRRAPERGYSASEEFDSDDDDTLSMASPPRSGAATPARAKSRSRRNSFTPDTDLQSSQLQANFVFAAMVAAWRDHLAPQIQNFQPHMPWTLPNLPNLPNLPPLPNLPDYQAHQLYRTLSSLVPPFPGLAGQSSPDTKDAVSRALMEDSSAPPAYEDIYPAASQREIDTKVASAAQAAAEAAEDQKCAVKYDRYRRSTGTTRIVSGKTVRRDASASGHDRTQPPGPTVKRLRNDRRLFFIWIPILILVVLAMSKDPVLEVWHFAQQSFAPASEATDRPAEVTA